MKALSEFQRRKDFLICVDSDGCAMDTMDIKHFRCFGPCMVKEWGLERWACEILDRWNEINLYSMTRGINRFLALAMALKEVDARLKPIEGIDALEAWTKESDELSNASVKARADASGIAIFRKALAWSQAVNEAITHLPEETKKPFDGVAQGLRAAHEAADIAIVSSANPEAVQEEWVKYGLMDCVDVCLAQDVGSKAYCIGKMLEYGYEKNHVLMVGDAPGDLKAAEKNGVLYYPILVRHEKESWERFAAEALPEFQKESYEGDYEQRRKAEFRENLS